MPTESVIDTLRLDIVVNNKGGTRTINSVSKSVKNLSQTLQHADLSKLVSLANTFQKFGGLGENVKGVSRLNTSLRTLNKNLANIDTAIFKSKFAEMTSAITPFIDKVNSAQASLQALQGVMGGAKTLTKANITPKATAPKSSGVGNKLNTALNIGSIVGKLYFAVNATKRLGQTLAQVVQYGIDYEETLNLWQVAMRGNISQARIFVSEMNKAYGVSEATLMNYQAIFRNMLSALGNISEASSYVISESLTQMALDFASLYNTSVESAMTKFQAVLSGQVRPIRTAGYDITEQTLFQLYQQLGGTKTVRQLNQTEKQLLRILAVFKQMETVGATGDLRKTIESSANQLRIMKEQAKDFATWVGISLNLLLQESKILITINGYLIALKELAKSVAFALGYQEKNFMVEFAEGAEDANKETEKLKQKLLGFDKFQVLSSAGTEDADIEQTLLDALGAYDSILDGFENPAVAKAEELLKAMGLHLEDVKNEQGEVIGQVWKFAEGEKSILDYIKDIATALTGVVTLAGVLVGIFTGNWLSLIGSFLAGAEALLFIGKGGELEKLGGSLQELFSLLFELFKQIGEIAMPIIKFLSDLIIVLLPLLIDIIDPLIPALEPLRKILNDALWLIKAIVVVLAPIVGFVADLLGLLTPILEVVHGITWVISLIASGIVQIIGFIAVIPVAILETVLNILLSIGEVIRSLFQWDWGSLGQNINKIWAEWRVSDLATTVSDMTIIPSWFADGGVATKGSLFYAGEAGPELVTQTSGGGSTIMNMRQLEDAVARGFIRGFASTDKGYEDDTTEVYVDGQRLFNIMRGTAKRNGYDFVKV